MFAAKALSVQGDGASRACVVYLLIACSLSLGLFCRPGFVQDGTLLSAFQREFFNEIFLSTLHLVSTLLSRSADWTFTARSFTWSPRVLFRRLPLCVLPTLVFDSENKQAKRNFAFKQSPNRRTRFWDTSISWETRCRWARISLAGSSASSPRWASTAENDEGLLV